MLRLGGRRASSGTLSFPSVLFTISPGVFFPIALTIPVSQAARHDAVFLFSLAVASSSLAPYRAPCPGENSRFCPLILDDVH